MESLELVVAIKKTSHQDNKTVEVYEQTFPVVAGFVRDMGGSFNDAKDIFHDALVIYYETVSQSYRIIKTTDEAYIFGIAKHLWFREYKQKSSNIQLPDLENLPPVPADYYPTTNSKRLLKFLEIAGKKCMDLLRTFYYKNLPVKDLARTLGYSNEHSVSVQKYKCLEKIRNIIKEKSLSYNDFIE